MRALPSPLCVTFAFQFQSHSQSRTQLLLSLSLPFWLFCCSTRPRNLSYSSINCQLLADALMTLKPLAVNPLLWEKHVCEQ